MIIDSMIRPLIVRALIAGLGVAVPAMAAAQAAQAPQAPKATRPAPARAPVKRYALSVKNEDGFLNVALKARQARMADIAADLGLRLRARVVVGPELAKDAVSVDVPSSPLEAVLQALAPRVLVDYEVRQDAQPRPLVIYLLAPADTEPTANVAARGVSQGVVISGHTEETPTADGSDPVTISGDAHQLSIAAKQQPLALVAMAVADILGITLDMDYPAGELVEVSVASLPAEDAVLAISPNVRLHVRVDLSRAERTPLKLVVTRPAVRAAR
jgi:hypothetical protein